ncbi:MAG: D-2-hydroxyacid dehydrogenase [Bacteroidales bacterium]|nr:D-2-hydroxyacid dehydrogenase [Bacteroidales bacterium]
MKIVFLDADTLGATPTSEFASLGEFLSYPTSTREEALARVGNCNTLIINKIIVDAALMDAAPNLKLICVTATGVNNIDLVEAEKRGIAVRNVSGYSTDSVVQSTFAHLLSLLGDSPYFDDCVKSGRYSSMSIFCDISHPYTEIVGKTLGIIGLGAIGKRVAAIAGMFGMKVIYYSTSGTSHCKLYPSVSLDELLESSDVVSIHAPLNERTRSLIGQAQLAKMKKSALLLNLGRGGIVDEEALAFAVDNGVIAGAALDVFEKEPLPATSPLLHLRHPERFRFSPHTAWASREALARLVSKVADNIRNFYGLQA